LAAQKLSTETSQIVPDAEARRRSLAAQTGLANMEAFARRMLPFQSNLIELDPTTGHAITVHKAPTVETLTRTNSRTGFPEQYKSERPYEQIPIFGQNDVKSFREQAGIGGFNGATKQLPAPVSPPTVSAPTQPLTTQETRWTGPLAAPFTTPIQGGPAEGLTLPNLALGAVPIGLEAAYRQFLANPFRKYVIGAPQQPSTLDLLTR